MKPGFTLIEILVYLGLFAILIGGSVAVAYSVIEGSDRVKTQAMLVEEGAFLLGKISWTLSGARAVNVPAIGFPGSLLSVNKVVGLDGGSNPIIAPVGISASGTDMLISRGGGETLLNNTAVRVQNLTFIHASALGEGIDPESLTAAFTLSANTATGAVVSKDFSSTSYLRK